MLGPTYNRYDDHNAYGRMALEETHRLGGNPWLKKKEEDYKRMQESKSACCDTDYQFARTNDGIGYFLCQSCGKKCETTTQPAPKTNSHPHVADELIKDILERKAKGMETYGTPLQPFNGRDALQDALEEALDLAAYIKQAIMERDNNNGL